MHAHMASFIYSRYLNLSEKSTINVDTNTISAYKFIFSELIKQVISIQATSWSLILKNK